MTFRITAIYSTTRSFARPLCDSWASCKIQMVKYKQINVCMLVCHWLVYLKFFGQQLLLSTRTDEKLALALAVLYAWQWRIQGATSAKMYIIISDIGKMWIMKSTCTWWGCKCIDRRAAVERLDVICHISIDLEVLRFLGFSCAFCTGVRSNILYTVYDDNLFIFSSLIVKGDAIKRSLSILTVTLGSPLTTMRLVSTCWCNGSYHGNAGMWAWQRAAI